MPRSPAEQPPPNPAANADMEGAPTSRADVSTSPTAMELAFNKAGVERADVKAPAPVEQPAAVAQAPEAPPALNPERPFNPEQILEKAGRLNRGANAIPTVVKYKAEGVEDAARNINSERARVAALLKELQETSDPAKQTELQSQIEQSVVNMEAAEAEIKGIVSILPETHPASTLRRKLEEQSAAAPRVHESTNGQPTNPSGVYGLGNKPIYAPKRPSLSPTEQVARAQQKEGEVSPQEQALQQTIDDIGNIAHQSDAVTAQAPLASGESVTTREKTPKNNAFVTAMRAAGQRLRSRFREPAPASNQPEQVPTLSTQPSERVTVSSVTSPVPSDVAEHEGPEAPQGLSTVTSATNGVVGIELPSQGSDPLGRVEPTFKNLSQTGEAHEDSSIENDHPEPRFTQVPAENQGQEAARPDALTGEVLPPIKKDGAEGPQQRVPFTVLEGTVSPEADGFTREGQTRAEAKQNAQRAKEKLAKLIERAVSTASTVKRGVEVGHKVTKAAAEFVGEKTDKALKYLENRDSKFTKILARVARATGAEVAGLGTDVAGLYSLGRHPWTSVKGGFGRVRACYQAFKESKGKRTEAFMGWYNSLAPRHKAALAIALSGGAGLAMSGAAVAPAVLGVLSGAQRILGAVAYGYKKAGEYNAHLSESGINLSAASANAAREAEEQRREGNRRARNDAMAYFAFTSLVGATVFTAADMLDGDSWLARMMGHAEKAPSASVGAEMQAPLPVAVPEEPMSPPRIEEEQMPTATDLYPPLGPSEAPDVAAQAGEPAATEAEGGARSLEQTEKGSSSRTAEAASQPSAAPDAAPRIGRVADVTLEKGQGFEKGVQRLFVELQGKGLKAEDFPPDSDMHKILSANEKNIGIVAGKITQAHIKTNSEIATQLFNTDGSPKYLKLGTHVSIDTEGNLYLTEPTRAEAIAISKAQNLTGAAKASSVTLSSAGGVDESGFINAFPPQASAEAAEIKTEPPSNSAPASVAESVRPDTRTPVDDAPSSVTRVVPEDKKIISEPLPPPEYSAASPAEAQTASPRSFSQQGGEAVEGRQTFFTSMWNEAINPNTPMVYEVQDTVTGEKGFFAYGGTDAQRFAYAQEELLKHPEKYQGKPIRWTKELPSIAGPITSMSEINLDPSQPGAWNIGLPQKPLGTPIPGDPRWQFLRKVL